MSNQGGDDYASRRAQYRRMITIYGRKAVLEALQDQSLDCTTLHLANSNRRGGIVADLIARAESRGIAINTLDREELARISRNGRQDQGVALDIRCAHMRELDHYLEAKWEGPQCLLALDGVTNPQNAGMAIRSAVAAGVNGILYADRGNPSLGPLVIKASSGTVFRAPLLRCNDIATASGQCLKKGFTLYRLQAGGKRSLFDGKFSSRALFVLGGETNGISDALQALEGEDVAIPMAAGVESLNVAVSAALVGYAATHLDK